MMKKSKHDRTIDALVERLLNSWIDYDVIKQQEEYKIGDVYGECDLYAINGSNLLLFEVKSFNSRKNRLKAYKQLQKDKLKYVKEFKPQKVYMFCVYATKNGYNIEWVRL